MATVRERDAVARINDALSRYGLPKSLGKWVWNQVVVQGLSESEILLELRERPEFKERFPAIDAGVPISPAEYVEYEQNALALFQQSGIAGALFDDPQEFQDFIAEQLQNDVALPELNQRLNQNFVDVANAPQEVRDAFGEFFMDTEAGDQALAAFMLDPDLSLPKLERMIQTAQVAGAGARFDFGISESFAQRAAELGITQRQASESFGQAARLRPLTQQLAGERQSFNTQALLQGTVMDDAEALDQLRRRQEGRVGAFQSGAQGVTDAGVTGLGSASDQ